MSQRILSAITLTDAVSSRNSPKYGDITIATDAVECEYQEYWYRGTWWNDNISVFWYEVNNGKLQNCTYDEKGVHDIATLGASAVIDEKKTKEFKFVLTWNVPNCYNYWSPCKDENGNDVIWKNYYAVMFKNSFETARYSLRHFNRLYKKTQNLQARFILQRLIPPS